MQNDYIMRTVEQFMQALITIIRKRTEGNCKEAIEDIKKASRYYLRTDIDILLLTHTPDQISEQFTDNMDTEGCVLFADLLYELALTYQFQNLEKESNRIKMICLQLYTIEIPKKLKFQSSQYFQKIDHLTQELKILSLSEETLE